MSTIKVGFLVGLIAWLSGLALHEAQARGSPIPYRKPPPDRKYIACQKQADEQHFSKRTERKAFIKECVRQSKSHPPSSQ